MLAMKPLPIPLFLLLAAALSACGGGESRGTGSAASSPSWQQVLDEAKGQRVDWWMYGGDDRVNRYVDEYVVPAADKLGVEVRRVPVTDTAEAVQRVIAQRRAGRRGGGAVDLIWINGENFASGKKAGLWLENWARGLPNSRYLDPEDRSVRQDFQVPVDGQEAPWSRAAFVFATDVKRVPDAPDDLDDLLTWARSRPGRFTYPAPPDFTGSAFVRQVVAAKGEDAGFAYLRDLQPLMYRAGKVMPKSEAELNELFSNGEVDVAMSYDASFVLSGVRKGQFPKTVRPFVLAGGTLTNVSFLTIPADAADAAGAKVVANLLLSPALQARKAHPAILGHPTVLDLDRVPPVQRGRFAAATSSPYVLADVGPPLEELAANRVDELERRWKREILQR